MQNGFNHGGLQSLTTRVWMHQLVRKKKKKSKCAMCVFSISSLPPSMSAFLAAIVLILTMPDSAAWAEKKRKVDVYFQDNIYPSEDPPLCHWWRTQCLVMMTTGGETSRPWLRGETRTQLLLQRVKKKTDFPSELFGHGEGEEARTAQAEDMNQWSGVNAGYNPL